MIVVMQRTKRKKIGKIYVIKDNNINRNFSNPFKARSNMKKLNITIMGNSKDFQIPLFSILT